MKKVVPRYPTVVFAGGGPTPAEELWICDTCGFAEWAMSLYSPVRYCHEGKYGKPDSRHDARMRKATNSERVAAIATIQKRVGTGKFPRESRE